MLLYILAALGFSAAYAIPLKDDFYAPYAYLEKPWAQSRDDFKNYLGDAFFDEIARKTDEDSHTQIDPQKKRYLVSDQGPRAINNFHVGEDKTIDFDVYLSAAFVLGGVSDDPNQTGEAHEFYCHMKFSVDMNTQMLTGKELYDVARVHYEPSEFCKKDTIDRLFYTVDYSLGLPLKPEKSAEVKSLAEGRIGAPSSVSDNYWRMLYFSLVVITTLGLGDIVPMTLLARACVGAEALLGILLIGLFINSVAWRANNHRGTDDTIKPP